MLVVCSGFLSASLDPLPCQCLSVETIKVQESLIIYTKEKTGMKYSYIAMCSISLLRKVSILRVSPDSR